MKTAHTIEAAPILTNRKRLPTDRNRKTFFLACFLCLVLCLLLLPRESGSRTFTGPLFNTTSMVLPETTTGRCDQLLEKYEQKWEEMKVHGQRLLAGDTSRVDEYCASSDALSSLGEAIEVVMYKWDDRCLYHYQRLVDMVSQVRLSIEITFFVPENVGCPLSDEEKVRLWSDLLVAPALGATQFSKERGYQWTASDEDNQRAQGNQTNQWHTTVDSIISIPRPERGDSLRVAVLSTNHYDDNGHWNECSHCGVYVGLVLFERVGDDSWESISTRPLDISAGTWGSLPTYSVEKIGPSTWALILDNYFMREGTEREWKTIIPIRPGRMTIMDRFDTRESYECPCSEELCEGKGYAVVGEWRIDRSTPRSAKSTKPQLSPA